MSLSGFFLIYAVGVLFLLFYFPYTHFIIIIIIFGILFRLLIAGGRTTNITDIR